MPSNNSEKKKRVCNVKPMDALEYKTEEESQVIFGVLHSECEDSDTKCLFIEGKEGNKKMAKVYDKASLPKDYENCSDIV